MTHTSQNFVWFSTLNFALAVNGGLVATAACMSRFASTILIFQYYYRSVLVQLERCCM